MLALTSWSTSLLGVPLVIDGDTFEGDSVRVRLGGLHAPERDEPGGADATAFMRRLTAGQTVSCEISGGDRYGRAVAICYLPDGRDVAGELVRAGLGRDCARYSGGRYAELDVRPDMRLPGYCSR